MPRSAAKRSRSNSSSRDEADEDNGHVHRRRDDKIASNSNSELLTATVDINDSRNRFLVTRAVTQGLFVQRFGVEVRVVGRYYPSRALATERAPPLAVELRANDQDQLNRCVQHINELLARDSHIDPAAAPTHFSASRAIAAPPPSASSPSSSSSPPITTTRTIPHVHPSRTPTVVAASTGTTPLVSPNTTTIPPTPASLRSSTPTSRNESTNEAEVIDVGIPADVPWFPLRLQLLGPGGLYMRHIETEARCSVQLRGRGSGNVDPISGREEDRPLYLYITPGRRGNTDSNVTKATELCHSLLRKVRLDYERALTSRRDGDRDRDGRRPIDTRRNAQSPLQSPSDRRSNYDNHTSNARNIVPPSSYRHQPSSASIPSSQRSQHDFHESTRNQTTNGIVVDGSSNITTTQRSTISSSRQQHDVPHPRHPQQQQQQQQPQQQAAQYWQQVQSSPAFMALSPEIQQQFMMAAYMQQLSVGYIMRAAAATGSKLIRKPKYVETYFKLMNEYQFKLLEAQLAYQQQIQQQQQSQSQEGHR